MKRLLAACLSVAVAGSVKADEQSTSPYATAADFAKYAMKLREQALLKVEPQIFIPTSSHPAIQRYPWKTNIVTTVFWVGEQAAGNNPVPNYKSAWDFNWTTNYGGYDNPDASAENKPEATIRFPTIEAHGTLIGRRIMVATITPIRARAAITFQ